MRADRLLALIRLLSDGRPRTLPVLAEALEVSERTVARDLDALAEAGAPLERARGRQGGVSLPRGWSRLSVGLTAAEVVPVAALLAPRAAEAELAAALSKIVATLPATQRLIAEQARQRLLLDPSPWWASAAAPWLEPLRAAVWQDRRIRLGYQGPRGASQRELSPLALAAKADRWHLVADTEDGLRVFRLDRITAVEVLDSPSVRPEDFDLPSFWRSWCARFEAERPRYPVRLRLSPAGRRALAADRPPAETCAIAEDAIVEIDFQRQDIALSQLVLLAGEAEVLAPEALRQAMAAVAAAWGRPADR